MSDTPAKGTWITVTPKRRSRRSAGIGGTLKSRNHKERLLQVLLDPPQGFDFSNLKMAEAMGLSSRQVTRLLKQLESEGRLKLAYSINRIATGGVYTTRTIQVLKEST